MRDDQTTAPHRPPRRVPPLLAVLAFLGVASLLFWRVSTLLNVPGRPDLDDTRWAFADFRDAIYYPVAAFLDGNNPYDAASFQQAYPVGNPFAPYLPLTLVLHLPFGLLPFETAEILHGILTLALTLVLAHMSLRLASLEASRARVFGAGALLLLSRPGHWNLVLGQPTLQVVIGAYLALSLARSRPWLAGLGLAVSTLKPSFGVPLGLLMLARRDTRAVGIGVAIAVTVTAAVAMVLVHGAGGIASFAAELRAGFMEWESSSDPFVNPVAFYGAVDAPAFVSRLLGRGLGAGEELVITVAVVALGALATWRLAEAADGPARLLSSCLICLTVVTCTHHQSYDALLLAFPLTALAGGTWTRAGAPASRRLRWLLAVLLGVPFANYLASATGLEWLGITGVWELIACSANAAALLAVLLIHVAVAVGGEPARVRRAAFGS